MCMYACVWLPVPMQTNLNLQSINVCLFCGTFHCRNGDRHVHHTHRSTLRGRHRSTLRTRRNFCNPPRGWHWCYDPTLRRMTHRCSNKGAFHDQWVIRKHLESATTLGILPGNICRSHLYYHYHDRDRSDLFRTIWVLLVLPSWFLSQLKSG